MLSVRWFGLRICRRDEDGQAYGDSSSKQQEIGDRILVEILEIIRTW